MDEAKKESISSVTLEIGAKGDVKPTLKVYVGTTAEQMKDAENRAFDTLRNISDRLKVGEVPGLVLAGSGGAK